MDRPRPKTPRRSATQSAGEASWHDEVGKLEEDLDALRGIGKALSAAAREMSEAAREARHSRTSPSRQGEDRRCDTPECRRERRI
ncbi:hypothetical protein [Amycolatopsis sp. NPDC004079]|uniref:hypothetical protein n=1 Tax=Amycolatopsis sp. NPDC004079 TaxID=3154549 RepID=UPI0033B50F3B